MNFLYIIIIMRSMQNRPMLNGATFMLLSLAGMLQVGYSMYKTYVDQLGVGLLKDKCWWIALVSGLFFFVAFVMSLYAMRMAMPKPEPDQFQTSQHKKRTERIGENYACKSMTEKEKDILASYGKKGTYDYNPSTAYDYAYALKKSKSADCATNPVMDVMGANKACADNLACSFPSFG